MHCPRCSGLIITNHFDTYCFACGYRPNDPVVRLVSTDRETCEKCQRRPFRGERICWYHKVEGRAEQRAAQVRAVAQRNRLQRQRELMA